ncbi:hypothetical protein [Piscicoccus intestinalis]|uniref:hypothetical protein n=1 Tax=Piscicoccus intestinalis TaxID=746033 RepID=UPI0012ED4205|nr:hypothetical protein [Piscicoccus intestinalis]
MDSNGTTQRAIHRTGSDDADADEAVTQTVPRPTGRHDGQRLRDPIPTLPAQRPQPSIDRGAAPDHRRLHRQALQELSATRQTVDALRRELCEAHERLHCALVDAEEALEARRCAQARLAQTMARPGARVDSALLAAREMVIRWGPAIRRLLSRIASVLGRNWLVRKAAGRLLPARWVRVLRRGLAGAGVDRR